jgi:hypothetical protein
MLITYVIDRQAKDRTEQKLQSSYFDSWPSSSSICLNISFRLSPCSADAEPKIRAMSSSGLCRQSISKPADLDRLSFLNLSPELRNQIYVYIVSFADPLLIAGTRRPRLCRRDGDLNTLLEEESYQPRWGKSFDCSNDLK